MDDAQYKLHQVKLQESRALNSVGIAEPKWLAAMPNVYNVTLPFSRLIEQLPPVQATKNPQVIETFFRQLVTELTKLYTYRVEIIELSDTMTEAEKAKATTECLTEGRDYIAKLGALLLYGDE